MWLVWRWRCLIWSVAVLLLLFGCSYTFAFTTILIVLQDSIVTNREFHLERHQDNRGFCGFGWIEDTSGTLTRHELCFSVSRGGDAVILYARVKAGWIRSRLPDLLVTVLAFGLPAVSNPFSPVRFWRFSALWPFGRIRTRST
jgi:hypothetical protein